MRKLLKTKRTIGRCHGMLLRLASRHVDWGRACLCRPAAAGRQAEARPYNDLPEEEKRQQGCRTPKAPQQAGLEVAW